MPESRELELQQNEFELIAKAVIAMSDCNWIVGEAAAKWMRRFSRCRSDSDFGELVGMSGDQIFQRRRVWESFADVKQNFPSLKWSHFYVAITWHDAPEMLQWAEEQGATVAEMRAWRRAVHGIDLTDDIDS